MGDPSLEDLVRMFLQAAPPSERELEFVRELLSYRFVTAVPQHLRESARRTELEETLAAAEQTVRVCQAELRSLRGRG